MLFVLDNQRAQAVATLTDRNGKALWGVAYIIVNGAGNVRAGNDPQVLKNDNNDGIPLTSATPSSQSFVWFEGILFAIADVATKVSVQVWGGGGPVRHQ